ncbi:unnamed protein product [Microthlaspi erraticum]|uniref:Uncharacterized protein n=1 Tax=Microthlaspi erraticum TaxID=1685480 RepID=A0A6D2I478_9BRAS|nr:unnamed protein product [Microthlaspi erraticum]
MLRKCLHPTQARFDSACEDFREEGKGSEEQEDSLTKAFVGLQWFYRGDLGARGKDEVEVQEVVRQAGEDLQCGGLARSRFYGLRDVFVMFRG